MRVIRQDVPVAQPPRPLPGTAAPWSPFPGAAPAPPEALPGPGPARPRPSPPPLQAGPPPPRGRTVGQCAPSEPAAPRVSRPRAGSSAPPPYTSPGLSSPGKGGLPEPAGGQWSQGHFRGGSGRGGLLQRASGTGAAS